MNETQRADAIRHFANRSTFEEVIAMVETTRRDFTADWTTGKRDAENGATTVLADFYFAASSARFRARAELREEAVETGGTKRSSDLLAVLRALEAEEEPTALSEETSVRDTDPILSLSDRIAALPLDDPERARLVGVQRDAELALHDLFAELTAPKETVA